MVLVLCCYSLISLTLRCQKQVIRRLIMTKKRKRIHESHTIIPQHYSSPQLYRLLYHLSAHCFDFTACNFTLSVQSAVNQKALITFPATNDKKDKNKEEYCVSFVITACYVCQSCQKSVNANLKRTHYVYFQVSTLI